MNDEMASFLQKFQVTVEQIWLYWYSIVDYMCLFANHAAAVDMAI